MLTKERRQCSRTLPITVFDSKNLPAIRQKPLADILGECDGGIAIDGNICSKWEYNAVTRYKMSKLTVVVIDLGTREHREGISRT